MINRFLFRSFIKMSQPSKASGDHIITIDSATPTLESEKPLLRVKTFAKRNSIEQNQADIIRTKNAENAGLDGETQKKSKFQRFLPLLIRLLLLFVPAGLFSIPIILAFTHEGAKNAHIGGVWIRWFFIWVEICWCSIWLTNISAKYILPHVARLAIGIFSKKAKKYRYVITELEVPSTLCGWSFASLISFRPLMYGHETALSNVNWRRPASQVLAAFFVSSIIYLVKAVMIQIVYIRYRQAQLSDKVIRNKESIELLTKLYFTARQIQADNTCAKLRADDLVLEEASTFSVGIFATLEGKNPEEQGLWAEASAKVIWALENRKTGGISLARRIWNTFVKPGRDSLSTEDLKGAFTDPKLVAKTFAILDKDNNGDLTLDEMISAVSEIARERKDLYSGWSDSQDIVKNFSHLCNVVVVGLTVLVFLAFLTSVKNTFGYAATVLASLGFAFNGTITEMFAAIIFIFVKHPFDVGDFIVIDKEDYIVEHISLLYTQVRNISNSKYTHFPNSVLNSKMVENVSRSKAMQESFTISASYDTTEEDVDLLREEICKFTEKHSRDFHSQDLMVEICGFALDKIDVKIQVKYKGNYADGKRVKRRAMILKELMRLTRLIPMFAPGGGYAVLGSGENPTFGVSVSPDDAKARIEAFKQDKETNRLAKKND